MIVSDTAIKNRVSVGVLVVLIIAAGAYSYLTLPREAAPDVPIPYVLITTAYEGVSPEDVESSVTMKIEQKLTGLKGVKEISSTSAEGVSTIVVEFLPDVVVEDALQYVRDKVDLAKGDLPSEEARKEPVISEINVAEIPIMMISLSGDTSMVRLKEIADDLEDAIESIPGVLNCDVLGAPEREIRLEIDPDRVAAYGLTIPEILTLIPTENVNVSAGGLETPGTRFNVRLPAEFVKPEEVDHLLLATRQGRPIYLSDVAKVRDTFKDRMSLSRLDGRPSITVSVQKRVGANILFVAEGVQRVLKVARQAAPRGVKFELILDFSRDIRVMVADLENNMAAAFILVMLVLVVFMGWRTSLIVALIVPLSMLLSFWIIQALGYTLNMIVLFSLVLAVGMLVDNAIVIVENIYRYSQMGLGRVEAAMKGAAEVAWPVITSTLTTVVAFVPLLFWPGIAGNFMKYLPITVIVVLSSSLFVALVVNPTVCAVFGTGRRKERTGRHPFLRGYGALLEAALNHRLATLTCMTLLLAGLAMLYAKRGAGVEFFPDIDPKTGTVNIRCPQGTNILETDRLARRAEQEAEKVRGDLDNLVASVGAAGGRLLFAGGSGGPHLGHLTMIFHDYEKRTVRPSVEAVAEVRRNLRDIPGAEIEVAKEKEGPPTGAAVTVRFTGKDFSELERLSERARRIIQDVPGLVNLRSDLEATRPELVFHVDRRRAMLLGVNPMVIGNFLKTAVFGYKVSTYRQYNDEYDITVRLGVDQRKRIDDLLRLRVPNTSGSAVPLSSLGDFEYRGGFGTISRVNQKRAVTLTGDAEGRLGNDVLRDVQARLARLVLPGGYEIRYVGEREMQEESQAFLGPAFVVALLLIALVLVAQFNTLSVPLVIMTTVILSLIGVLIGLLANHMPFGIVMTGVGVIGLAGVVVNNAIVMLDFTRQLQKRGRDVVSAAAEAATVRLRPVLLTAGTTVIALLPTALGMSFDIHTLEWVTRSESSQWWKGMAVAVIYGLSFATILTLVVVPTLYVTFYKAAARLGRGGLVKVGTDTEVRQPVLEDF